MSVNQPTELTLVGPDGYFGAINRRNDSVYTVTADIRKEGNDPGEISVAALEGAGTDYPPEIEALYGADAVPDGAIPAGGKAEQLLDQLVDEAPNPDNPYDFAEFLRQRFVQSPDSGGIFTYVTDINSLMEASCKSISIVECFATYKQGFCQYYASTMAIFLREQGIPARVVEGYLPSQRSPQGEEIISGGGRHQWVEVYFPGYGWVDVRSDRRRRLATAGAHARRPWHEPAARPVGRRDPHPSARDGLRAAGHRRRWHDRVRRADGAAHRDHDPARGHRRRARVRRVDARPARWHDRRPRLSHGDPVRRRGSGSGRDRTRPSTSTRGRSARCSRS